MKRLMTLSMKTRMIVQPIDEDEIEKPADDNIIGDTPSTDQSTDNTIITEEQVNEYRSVIQNYTSLIDYYDFLIQDHLGLILPVEDDTIIEVPLEGDDLTDFPAEDETAEGNDASEVPTEDEDVADETVESDDAAEVPAVDEEEQMKLLKATMLQRFLL